MLSRFHLIPERYGQTDGQTDTLTDGQICYINIAHQHTALLTRDKNSQKQLKQSKQQKMTTGVPIVTCLHRVRRIHEVRVRVRVPCPPNTQSHSVCVCLVRR